MHALCPTPPKKSLDSYRLNSTRCSAPGGRSPSKPKLPRCKVVDRIHKRLDRCSTSSLERLLEDIERPTPADEIYPPHDEWSPGPLCSQLQLEQVFHFFDKNNSGTIEKSEVEAVVKQLKLDVAPETLNDMMDRFPQDSLTFPIFSECLKQLGLFTSIVSGAVMHLNKTIIRAKKLGLEMHSKVSLDKQLTNLFHMQNHYRMINKAKASVDSWHYATTSKCYHSHTLTTPSFRKNRRWLPMERMHMILSHTITDNGESWMPLPPVRKPKKLSMLYGSKPDSRAKGMLTSWHPQHNGGDSARRAEEMYSNVQTDEIVQQLYSSGVLASGSPSSGYSPSTTALESLASAKWEQSKNNISAPQRGISV